MRMIFLRRVNLFEGALQLHRHYCFYSSCIVFICGSHCWRMWLTYRQLKQPINARGPDKSEAELRRDSLKYDRVRQDYVSLVALDTPVQDPETDAGRGHIADGGWELTSLMGLAVWAPSSPPWRRSVRICGSSAAIDGFMGALLIQIAYTTLSIIMIMITIVSMIMIMIIIIIIIFIIMIFLKLFCFHVSILSYMFQFLFVCLLSFCFVMRMFDRAL